MHIMVEASETGDAEPTVQLCQFSIFFDLKKEMFYVNQTLDNALEALISAQVQPIMEFLISDNGLKPTVRIFIF